MNDIYGMVHDLDVASEMLDCELGEWWGKLSALYPSLADNSSAEFEKAFEDEVRKNHAFLKSEFRIVESEVEKVVVSVKRLVHESEM
jgi:hypothetical protein